MSIHCMGIRLVPTRAAGYPHRADGDEKVLREAETELVDMVLKEDSKPVQNGHEKKMNSANLLKSTTKEASN